jgi:hypothetical protein
VAVQEVRWVEGCSQPRNVFRVFCASGKANHRLRTGFLIQKKIMSAVRKVESFSDRIPYIKLRGRWFDITVLNVHAPTYDKSDDTKDSFTRN